VLFSHGSRQAVDENVVQAQHLHERVLDELPRRARREEG
jgi:hypothetical protein